LAGSSASAIGTICLHPLDNIKVRLQAQDNKIHAGRARYNGFVDAIRQIKVAEGWRGFYSGVGANFSGGVIAWGTYFYFYSSFKQFYSNKKQRELNASDHMQCSLGAGFVTATLTNPIWVVKTRMILPPPKGTERYPNLFAAFKHIWRDEGFAGLMRGYGAAMIGVSHGAVQFVCYEELKSILRRNQLESDLSYFVSGALSKLIATTITYPYQVLRTRIQDRVGVGEQRIYSSTWQTIQFTFKNEGIRGFYRGLVPGVIRVMPMSAVVLMSYERILKILNKLNVE